LGQTATWRRAHAKSVALPTAEIRGLAADHSVGPRLAMPNQRTEYADGRLSRRFGRSGGRSTARTAAWGLARKMVVEVQLGVASSWSERCNSASRRGWRTPRGSGKGSARPAGGLHPEIAVRADRVTGKGIRNIAGELGIGVGTVQRIVE
jgi:hypothetical protein